MNLIFHSINKDLTILIAVLVRNRETLSKCYDPQFMFPKIEISNRRGFDRVALRTSAVLGLSDGRVIPARTLDIGKGGAGVVCDLNLIVGAVVSIRINLPSNSPVGAVFEATATVANCTLSNKDGGFRLGLQFNPLSAAAASALRAVAP